VDLQAICAQWLRKVLYGLLAQGLAGQVAFALNLIMDAARYADAAGLGKV
jgi:hypothetical protein